MEHRWYKRKLDQTAVEVFREGSWVGHGTLRDCSCMGAFVEGEMNVYQGQFVSLKAKRPYSNADTPALPALIVHKEQSGFGVMFVARADVVRKFTNRQGESK